MVAGALNSAPARAHRKGWARESVEFLAIVLIIWIAGQIVTQGLSDQYLANHPGQALAWRADSPDALTAFAQSRLAARDPAHAAAFARRALAESPLKVAAISTFGLALQEVGDETQADKVMSFAGSRGWRDALTQFWLLAHGLRTQDFDLAFQRADALLRRADRYQLALFQSLIYVVDNSPGAIGALNTRLEEPPSWRAAFLGELATDPHPVSGQIEQSLLEHLATTKAPPTDREVGGLVDRLVQEHRYSDAETEWRRLTPRTHSTSELIIDGDFDHAAGVAPFGWLIPQAVGWVGSIGLAPGAGHGQALRLEYDGFSTPQPLRQLLVLPPGDYRLSGQFYRELGAAPASPFWIVSCVQGATTPAPLPLNAPDGVWMNFKTAFTVHQGCQAQWLQLTADPGDHHLDSVTWYDNLAVIPVNGPEVG